MKYIWQLFILCFLVSPCFPIGQIACPLVWTDYHLGDTFPKHTVSNNFQLFSTSTNLNRNTSMLVIETETFIARIKLLGNYQIGTIDKHFHVSFHIRDLDTSTVLQLLTNPFNCNLQWVSTDGKFISTKHLVRLGTTTSATFLGSEKSTEGKNQTAAIWTPCRLKISHSLSCFSNCGSTTHQAGRGGKTIFALKSSTQPKLRVEIYNLVTHNETLGPPEKRNLGCDKIRNKGQVDVSRLVTHSKEKSDKTTSGFGFGLSGSFDGQVEFEFALVVLFVKTFYGGISIHLGLDLSGNIGFDKSEETRTTDSSTQRVNLPPGTMVEACSQAISRSFNYSFEGKARVSHSFLSLEEINVLLENDPRLIRPFELDRDGKSVRCGVVGNVRQIIQVESEFSVVPINQLVK